MCRPFPCCGSSRRSRPAQDKRATSKTGRCSSRRRRSGSWSAAESSSEAVLCGTGPDALQRDDRRNTIAGLAGKIVPDAVIVAIPSLLAAEFLFHDASDAVFARVVCGSGEIPGAEAFVQMRQKIERGFGLLLDFLPFIDFLVDLQTVESRRRRRELPDSQGLLT